MATTIRSADLDFDTIKSRLKEFLRKKSEFADYDFDGSTLYINFNPGAGTKFFIRALAN